MKWIEPARALDDKVGLVMSAYGTQTLGARRVRVSGAGVWEQETTGLALPWTPVLFAPLDQPALDAAGLVDVQAMLAAAP